MKLPFLLGRIAFGGYFLYNGINHFKSRKMMAQYAATKHVPQPEAAVLASGTLLLIGGASILTGIKPKFGAAAIIAFLVGVSPVMHDFWRNEDANQRMVDMANFTKNMALVGGALTLMGIEEPWPASVPVAQPGVIERARAYARRPIAA